MPNEGEGNGNEGSKRKAVNVGKCRSRSGAHMAAAACAEQAAYSVHERIYERELRKYGRAISRCLLEKGGERHRALIRNKRR